MKRLSDLYWRFIASPEAYARHIGVTIGEGAMVAAGSIVTKSVEPYTVVVGRKEL